MLPGAVADFFWAKKEERHFSEEQQRQGNVKFQHLCCHWDSLKGSLDSLLTISLAAYNHHQERTKTDLRHP